MQAIGYLRVSTREQGRNGLGLAAQRAEIEAFVSREGFTIRSWYRDVQTGAGADALPLRPGLATALKEAKSSRCPVIVSRLDRLSRQRALQGSRVVAARRSSPRDRAAVKRQRFRMSAARPPRLRRVLRATRHSH
jgi:DNA invertase Pin-like site-specific DNA recombinase